MKETAIIIQTTSNNKEIASRIISQLLDSKKVACVHIEDIESYYWWEGKIASHKEFRLSFKTIKSLSPEVIAIIKALHNYTLPEIIQINIDETTAEYLSWLIKETKQPIAH